jgi:hypothetical protein
MRVHDESAITKEADKRQAPLPRQLHGKAGRRRHRREQWHTCRECLLHDLEASASTDKKHVIGQWERSLEERLSEYLVDRVVTADVLSVNFFECGDLSNNRVYIERRQFYTAVNVTNANSAV